MTDYRFDCAPSSEFGLRLAPVVGCGILPGKIRHLNLCTAGNAFAAKTPDHKSAFRPFASHCFYLVKERSQTVAIIFIESILCPYDDPVRDGLSERGLVAKFMLFMPIPFGYAKNFRFMRAVNLVFVRAFLVHGSGTGLELSGHGISGRRREFTEISLSKAFAIVLSLRMALSRNLVFLLRLKRIARGRFFTSRRFSSIYRSSCP